MSQVVEARGPDGSVQGDSFLVTDCVEGKSGTKPCCKENKDAKENKCIAIKDLFIKIKSLELLDG